jgi:TM2 domain-containing membrane protein YozV
MTQQTNFEELNYVEQRVNSAAPNIFVAYLIWFFLGYLGIHRMFLGQKKGVLMLIIFVISVVLSVVMIGVIGFVVLFVWWIYDAIQIPKWIEEKKTDLRSKIQAEMQ